MAIERKLEHVAPTLFTSDGGSNGIITINDTYGIKVKASVIIAANSLPNLKLEVKRVISKNQLIVGLAGHINNKTDVSLYTVALSASIEQPEQDRPGVPAEQVQRYVYEEEPTLAIRNILVDRVGDPIDENNPLPVITEGVGKFIEIIGYSNWMNLATYDEVVPVFSLSDTLLTITYKEDGIAIGEALVTDPYSTAWTLKLNRYLNDDNNSILTNDDGAPLNLD